MKQKLIFNKPKVYRSESSHLMLYKDGV